MRFTYKLNYRREFLLLSPRNEAQEINFNKGMNANMMDGIANDRRIRGGSMGRRAQECQGQPEAQQAPPSAGHAAPLEGGVGAWAGGPAPPPRDGKSVCVCVYPAT